MAVRLTLGLLAGLACASGLTLQDGRFRDESWGFSVADPRASFAGWEQVKAPGAVLAFRGPGRRSMSLSVRCGLATAPPRMLARHLLIGLSERQVVSESGLELSGYAGWQQVVDAVDDQWALRLKTVTLLVGECTMDWVLVAPGAFDESEAVFDAWWSSFQPNAVASAEGAP